MGRPKGSKNRATIEREASPAASASKAARLAEAEASAAQAAGEKDAPASEPAASTAEAPRVKREYKKRTPKTSVKVQLPDELVAVLATAPLIIGGQVVMAVSHGQIIMHFPSESRDVVIPAFKAWLASIDVELSPGWALLLAYALAFALAMPDSVAQGRAAKPQAPQAQPQAPQSEPAAPQAATVLPFVPPTPGEREAPKPTT